MHFECTSALQTSILSHVLKIICNDKFLRISQPFKCLGMEFLQIPKNSKNYWPWLEFKMNWDFMIIELLCHFERDKIFNTISRCTSVGRLQNAHWVCQDPNHSCNSIQWLSIQLGLYKAEYKGLKNIIHIFLTLSLPSQVLLNLLINYIHISLVSPYK